MRNNHRSNNSKCTNSICTFSRIGHNLPNFIPKKISSTRPQRSYLMVDQSLPDYYEKTAKNSDWNSSIHATFSDIFHKIQTTGGGEGERKGGGWMVESNRNSYPLMLRGYKYFCTRWWWHRYDCSFNLDRESPPLRVL